MIQGHLLKIMTAAGVLTAVVSFSSCSVDNDFDLENIDGTVKIGTNLWLPNSSTESILLKNVLDLAEDGVVKVDEAGDHYILSKKDIADIDPVNIGKISFKKPSLSSFTATIESGSAEMAPARKSAPASQLKRAIQRTSATTRLTDEQMEQLICAGVMYEIDGTSGAKHTLSSTETYNISSDVVSIDFVEINPTKLTLSLKITDPSTGKAPVYAQSVDLGALALDLPEGLRVNKCTFAGEEIPVHLAQTTLWLVENDEFKTVDLSKNITVELEFDGAVVGNDKAIRFDSNNHKASFQGEFKLSGSVLFNADNINWNLVDDALLTQVLLAGSLKQLLPETLNVKGDASFDKDITLAAFSGAAQHSVGRVKDVVLNDIPDFLQDDDVVLDLQNPQLYMVVDNSLPANGFTHFTLSSVKDGKVLKTVTSPQIEVKGANVGSRNVYCFSKTKPEAYPSAYADAQHVEMNIADLLLRIPDRVKVDVETIDLPSCYVPIYANGAPVVYPVEMNYELYTQLNYGANFTIVYTDTIDGWNKDIRNDHYDDYDVESIGLKAKAETDLNMDLNVELNAVDVNGRIINEIETSTATIPAKAKGADINMEIKPKAGHTINEVINRVDGVLIKASTKNSNGNGELRPNNYVKLNNVRVGLMGGITIEDKSND